MARFTITFNKLLLVIGFVFLIHSAYSAAQRELSDLMCDHLNLPNIYCRPDILKDNRAGVNVPTLRCKL